MIITGAAAGAAAAGGAAAGGAATVPAAAALPPPFPPLYEVRTITQRADHFNSESNASFSARYLLNATWWGGAPAPILFYCGAEGDGVEPIWSHSGWIVDHLARNLSALVVFAEMRFFGVSMPFGPSSPRSARLAPGTGSRELRASPHRAGVRSLAFHSPTLCSTFFFSAISSHS